MKTLLTEEQFKLSFPDFEKETNKYNLERIKYAKDQSKLLSKYHPTSLFYRIDWEDGKPYFQDTEMHLQHEFLTFTVVKYEHNPQYYIFSRSLFKLEYINSNDIHNAVETDKKPNRMLKPSTKKIQDWINFYTEIYYQLQKINEERRQRINTFLNTIKQPKYHEFIRYHTKDYFKGEILKNCILYKWEIINKSFINIIINLLVPYDKSKINNGLTIFDELSNNNFNPEIK